MNNLLTRFLFFLLFVQCTGSDNSTLVTDNKPVMTGNILDTTLNSRQVRVDYYSDSSLVISVIDTNSEHTLKFSQSQLPKWYNPLGFDLKYDFPVLKSDGRVSSKEKFYITKNGIFVFPIINREYEADFCFFRVNNQGQPVLLFNNMLMPTQLLMPQPHMRIHFNERDMQVAYSEFFHTRQSMLWCKIIRLYPLSGAYAMGRIGLSEEECPVDLFTSDEIYNNWLKCLYEKLFPIVQPSTVSLAEVPGNPKDLPMDSSLHHKAIRHLFE
jgi:hypothetical protein